MQDQRISPIVKSAGLLLLVALSLGGDRALAQSGTRGGYSVPPQPRELAVSLVIKLPTDAVLEIQGAKTKQTGEVRRFQSPPLTVGARYTYTFKATWKEGDKEIVRERVVAVQPGTEVVVDLREEPAKK